MKSPLFTFLLPLMLLSTSITFGQIKIQPLFKNPYTKDSMPATRITKSKILEWLKSQVKDGANVRNQFVKLLQANALLEKRYIEGYRVDENFVLIPLKSTAFSQHIDKSKPLPLQFLLLVEDKNGEIRRGEVFLFYPSNKNVRALPYNAFYLHFVHQEFPVDGTLKMVTLDDFKFFEADFKNRDLVERRVWRCERTLDAKGDNIVNHWQLDILKINTNGEAQIDKRELGFTTSKCPPNVKCDEE